MQTSLKISRLYSEEHMVEIGIDVTTNNLSTVISCYTQTEKLQELHMLCQQFIKEPNLSFEWHIGSKEFAYFGMTVNPYDKHGHSKIDFVMLNNKDSTVIDNMYCECCLMLELGQIEYLGRKIIQLITDDSKIVII